MDNIKNNHPVFTFNIGYKMSTIDNDTKIFTINSDHAVLATNSDPGSCTIKCAPESSILQGNHITSTNNDLIKSPAIIIDHIIFPGNNSESLTNLYNGESLTDPYNGESLTDPYDDESLTDHKDAESADPSKVAATSNNLLYLPNTFTYRPTDKYARLFGHSTDIELIIKIDVGRRGVWMEAVEQLQTPLIVPSAVYCGTKLGSGVLQEIKGVHGQWTIVVVQFWTVPKEAIKEKEWFGESTVVTQHNIAFPTNKIDMADEVRATLESRGRSNIFRLVTAIDQNALTV